MAAVEQILKVVTAAHDKIQWEVSATVAEEARFGWRVVSTAVSSAPYGANNHTTRVTILLVLEREAGPDGQTAD